MGVTVPFVLANGHNNFIYSQVSPGMDYDSYGRIEHLIVQGHNNRFENLVAKEIEIYGHNNQLTEIYCQSFTDHGQSNKFRNLYQFEDIQQ